MSILTLAQAVRCVRKTGAPTSDETATLTEMIAALNGALEPVSGPIESEPRTWNFRSYGMQQLVLPWAYQSVSAIVSDGVTISSSLYDASTYATSGIITTVAYQVPPWQYRFVTNVTAMVGYASIPANLIYAAELLIQSWWETAWQGRGPSSEAMAWAPPKGDLPPAVVQAVGKSFPMPGFA